MKRLSTLALTLTLTLTVIALPVYASEDDGTVVNTDETASESETSEISYAINADNFPGIYKLLKNGYYAYDSAGNKEYYDADRDGVLSGDEISAITCLTNCKMDFISANGGYGSSPKYGYKKYQTKLTSLSGIEKLTSVESIELSGYAGKKLI